MYKLILVFFCIFSFPIWANAWQLSLNAKSENYSAVGSIDNTRNGLRRGYDLGRTAFIRNTLDVGAVNTFSIGDVYVGYIYRDEYYLKFSPDTARFIHDINTHQQFTQSQYYQINLLAHQVRAEGVHVQWSPRINQWQLVTGLSYLIADQVIDGQIRGNITSEDGEVYNGQLSISEIYHKDPLLERPNVKRPQGRGYTSDLGIKYFGDEFFASWLIEDAYSDIYWENAPYTTANVTTESAFFDDNGKLHKPSALAGFEGYKSFHQVLPEHHYFTFKWNSLPVKFDYSKNKYFENLKFTSLFYGSFEGLEIGYNVHYESLDFGFRKNNWHVRMAMNPVAVMDNQYVGLTLEYNSIK